MAFTNFWASRSSYQRLRTTIVSPKQPSLRRLYAIPSLIILLLATVVILLLRIVYKPIYRPLDDYQIMNVLPVVHSSQSNSSHANDRAVVTSLYSDNFAIATAVLGHSVRSVNSTARLIMMYIDGQVSHEALCISRAAGWETLAVPRISPPHGDKSVYYRFVDQYTKLNLWGLDQHGVGSLVYLDADTLVRRNFDELFDLPFNFAAVPDVYGAGDARGFDITFNAGVLALKTSSKALDHMKQMIGTARYPSGQAEQAFLNLYFGAKAARLPYIYNANLAIRSRSKTVWRELKEELSIIHYTLLKPFLSDLPSSAEADVDRRILTAEETEEAVDHAQSTYSELAEEFEWWRVAFRGTMEKKGADVNQCMSWPTDFASHKSLSKQ